MMRKINVLGISVFILFLLVVPTSALAWEHGISLSYGHGDPDSLDGGRISYQYHPEGYVWKSLFIYFDARGITQREVEIISLIMKGYSNRQIGEKLFISLSTVKKHVYSIFRKTNVKNRMALTVLIRKKSEKDF